MKRALSGVCLSGFMAVIIGVVGITGIYTMNEQSDSSYEYNIGAMPSIARVMELTQRLKALPYKALYETDMASFEQESANVLKTFEMYMSEFEPNIINAEVYGAFDELKSVYFNEYKPRLLEMLEHLKQGESRDNLTRFLDPMTANTNQMAAAADYCMNVVSDYAYMERDTAYYTARQLAMIIIVLIVLELVLSVIFIILIARYKGAGYPAYQKSYARGAAPPVYAMYPVDPSNPANPPHATHLLYPFMNTHYPPQTGAPRQSEETQNRD